MSRKEYQTFQTFYKQLYCSTIFAYPYNSGQNDEAAKYYNIGRTETQPFVFLNCNGFRKDLQTDCRT